MMVIPTDPQMVLSVLAEAHCYGADLENGILAKLHQHVGNFLLL